VALFKYFGGGVRVHWFAHLTMPANIAQPKKRLCWTRWRSPFLAALNAFSKFLWCVFFAVETSVFSGLRFWWG